MPRRLVIRAVTADDNREFMEIHHRSVHGLAARHYDAAVINAWAPAVSDDVLQRFNRNEDDEIRLLAELDGVAVGIGALVVADAELRACYVAPEAARQGIGSAIVREIERMARQEGLTRLTLQASLNAELFYTALGYQAVERGEHQLRGGQRMAAVKMTKRL